MKTAQKTRTSPAASGTKAAQDKEASSGPANLETRIYRTVFDSIMNQRLTPGTKLPESALCELFGAGRSVVRRALQRLAHDHMVDLRPNRGAIVSTPTPEEMRQIFEARRALEAAIVRLATQNAQPADFERLREQLGREHASMHKVDQTSWVRLASAFHLELASLANNPILEGYLKEIVSRCSLIVALYEPWGNASCEHDEHANIVECMERGDSAGAIQLMEHHLIELEQNIRLAKSQPEPSLKDRLGL